MNGKLVFCADNTKCLISSPTEGCVMIHVGHERHNFCSGAFAAGMIALDKLYIYEVNEYFSSNKRRDFKK